MPKGSETFSPEWLELREPVDHRSRSEALANRLCDAWTQRGWTRILDLGSGTGSNVRYLAPRLGRRQAWTLVDHDPDLLRRVGDVPSATAVRCCRGDLEETGLEEVLRTDVVTCSALLDLVSDTWLQKLVAACRRVGCGAYLVLSYNGVITWADHGHDDEMIRTAVNTHQQRHGAPGPAAANRAERLFQDCEFRTWCQPSPWHLTCEDAGLIRVLVDGWERAALELLGAGESRRIRAWADRRRRAAPDPATRLIVGHTDLLALPSSSLTA